MNLLNSPRKMDVLKILKPDATRSYVEGELKLTPSHLTQIIRDLERLGLVERKRDTIKVLPKGKIALEVHRVLLKFSRFFEKFGDLSNEFELADIPDWLISRFYELDSIEVIHNNENFVEPHRKFFSITSSTSAIMGYTPVFFNEYVDFFLELAERGVKIDLIMTGEVFSRILSDFPRELESGLSFDNVRLYVSRERYRFAFIVTDSHLLISFYLKTGVFDYMRDFVCRGNAVRWGNDLFEFVRGNSELIDRSKLNELLRR